MGVFFRRLRASLGGKPLPYLWVPEWHKTDHGLHLHFALGQYVPRGHLVDAWGHGFVHIKRLSDMPVGSTTIHEARRAAGYLSKYVTKAFEPGQREHLMGMHRYERAQGFNPPVTRLQGVSVDDLVEQAAVEMGGALPAISWSSAEAEGWQGPPAVWFAWD